ncbi:MAG: hypothetical protein WDM85_02850 [Caulobacteraceae bacterium]
MLTGVYGGRRTVHLPAFTPEIWVDEATAEKVTHAMVVPTMLAGSSTCWRSAASACRA